jgi:uncharacterized protein (DUF433 family)/DNA-binding XRE family transcriptional regulator
VDIGIGIEGRRTVREQPAAAARTFAHLLRTARQRGQFTQQEVATATGLPRSLISELEHGRSPVRLVHVRPLAEQLAATEDERQAMLACADPAAGTRRWGKLTGISPEDEQTILGRVQAGWSDADTAAARGLSRAQVQAVRRQHGVAALPRREQAARQHADRDHEVVAAYRAGLPFAEIVRHYAVPRSTLYEILERDKVPRRRRTGGRRKTSENGGTA